jgi:hypothetical protein
MRWNLSWGVAVGLLAAGTVSLAMPSRARACGFCGAGDVSPSVSLRQADAAAAAEVVGRKLVFSGAEGARSSVTLKLTGVLTGGDKVKAGTTITAVLDPKVLGNAGKAFVTLTVTAKAASVLDAYPDPDGKLAEYLAALAKIPGAETSPERIGFLARRLEDPDANVANDAQTMFSQIPDNVVRASAAALPVEKLREWLASEKIAPGRKGLYGYLLGMCGKDGDAERLRSALAGVGADNRNAVGGLLAGLCLLTGKPAEVLTPVISDAARPLGTRRAALYVVRLMLDYHAEPRLKPELVGLYKVGMADKKLAEYAVEEMARAGEFSLIEDVKALWLDPKRSTRNVQTFVRYFGAVMSDAKARTEFTKWLESHPAPNPPAEGD